MSNMSKQPPDKYKCIKLKFNNIININNTYNNRNIENTIDNAIKI